MAERQRRAATRRRLVAGLVCTVLLVGVLFVAVFPTRTWFAQRDATTRAEAELEQVQAERARIARETERLGTDEEIEKEARSSGYRMPNEEVINVLPVRTDPIGLPETWPFTGVEQVLGAG